MSFGRSVEWVITDEWLASTSLSPVQKIRSSVCYDYNLVWLQKVNYIIDINSELDELDREEFFRLKKVSSALSYQSTSRLIKCDRSRIRNSETRLHKMQKSSPRERQVSKRRVTKRTQVEGTFWAKKMMQMSFFNCIIWAWALYITYYNRTVPCELDFRHKWNYYIYSTDSNLLGVLLLALYD